MLELIPKATPTTLHPRTISVSLTATLRSSSTTTSELVLRFKGSQLTLYSVKALKRRATALENLGRDEEAVRGRCFVASEGDDWLMSYRFHCLYHYREVPGRAGIGFCRAVFEKVGTEEGYRDVGGEQCFIYPGGVC
jgi:hypothetical protein